MTRLICDSHDAAAFAPVAHLTVGEFRDWLHSGQATPERFCALAQGLIPEMAAAVSRIMRLQDLVSVAASVFDGLCYGSGDAVIGSTRPLTA